jgi:hypothetical protein
MSDRDPNSGQFAEPAFGQEGVLRDAGYVPFKEDNAEPEELTVAEAAEAHAAESLAATSRTPEGEIKTYSALDGLDDNVSLTIEQAAKIKADDEDADRRAAELAEDERTRNEVDELRGEKKADKAELPAQEQPSRSPSNTEIDPEIEKALSNPRIAEAISKQIGEAEQQRSHYSAGLEAATTIAQQAFISSFPEFASVPQEQHGAVLAALQQHNPARFNQLYNLVASTQGVFQAREQEHQRQTESKRADFAKYARAEDAKFADMMKGETMMPKIQHEIISAIKDYGHDPKDFFERYASEPILRDAAMQRMMVDAAKYRLIMKAPKAVATPNRPPVQRPGVSRGQSSANESLQNLEAKFNGSGRVEDAAAFLTAQRKARG